MKKIPILLIVLILTLVSCNKKEENNVEKGKAAIQNEASATVMESFSAKDFPEEVDGAGCSFGKDKKEYRKGNLIYADNLDSICYIKIKGQFIRLELFEYKEDTLLHTYSQKFKNDEFQLSIDAKQSKEGNGEEAYFFEGSMSIKHKDEPEQKTNLYGYCGC